MTAEMMKCAGTTTEASDAIQETPARNLMSEPLKSQYKIFHLTVLRAVQFKPHEHGLVIVVVLAAAVSVGLRLSARVSRHQLSTNT